MSVPCKSRYRHLAAELVLVACFIAEGLLVPGLSRSTSTAHGPCLCPLASPVSPSPAYYYG